MAFAAANATVMGEIEDGDGDDGSPGDATEPRGDEESMIWYDNETYAFDLKCTPFADTADNKVLVTGVCLI